MQLRELVYENEPQTAYVRQVKSGYYEVYRNGVTCAQHIGTYHFSDDPSRALTLAKERCDAC